MPNLPPGRVARPLPAVFAAFALTTLLAAAAAAAPAPGRPRAVQPAPSPCRDRLLS